jgi:hypothetical protein
MHEKLRAKDKKSPYQDCSTPSGMRQTHAPLFLCIFVDSKNLLNLQAYPGKLSTTRRRRKPNRFHCTIISALQSTDAGASGAQVDLNANSDGNVSDAANYEDIKKDGGVLKKTLTQLAPGAARETPKNGDLIQCHYIGRLQSTGKEFDRNHGG